MENESEALRICQRLVRGECLRHDAGGIRTLCKPRKECGTLIVSV